MFKEYMVNTYEDAELQDYVNTRRPSAALCMANDLLVAAVGFGFFTNTCTVVE